MINPGDAGRIIVVGQPPPAGEKSVDIVVTTNDAKQPLVPLRLVMTGDRVTIPYVAYHNGPVRFGSIQDLEEPKLLLITTREQAETTPWLSMVNARRAGVTIKGGLEQEKKYDDNRHVVRSYKYNVCFDEMPPPGEVRFMIDFFSTGSEDSVLSVLASGDVPMPVTASPAAIYMSAIDQAKSPTFYIELRSNAMLQDFEAIAEEIPGLKVVKTRQEGPLVVFGVTILPETVLPLEGRLSFMTNHPAAPTVEVPFLFATAVK